MASEKSLITIGFLAGYALTEQGGCHVCIRVEIRVYEKTKGIRLRYLGEE